MWTTFDAIGEITLTTKGKDSDPSTTAITTVSRCRGVNAWYGKRKYSWDSWETQGQGILGPILLLDNFNVNASLEEKSICGCCVGDKTSRWD
jgi:hypothetical protein